MLRAGGAVGLGLGLAAAAGGAAVAPLAQPVDEGVILLAARHRALLARSGIAILVGSFLGRILPRHGARLLILAPQLFLAAGAIGHRVAALRILLLLICHLLPPRQFVGAHRFE